MIRTVKDFDDMVERALKPPNNTLEKLMALARGRNGISEPENRVGLGTPNVVPNITPVRLGGRRV